ncbi:MAG: hypothetical protein IJ150_06460 [Bacteroidales bacterium]|nr:hypothetical protein [Bacteroidales bacterium]
MKILFAAAFLMTTVLIYPPYGNTGRPQGNRIPVPGKPPIIVVFPGSK